MVKSCHFHLYFCDRAVDSMYVLYIKKNKQIKTFVIQFLFFLAFDFCRFCVVIRFFHPRHTGQ